MINKEKWEQMTDEQKLQLCVTMDSGVNVRNITKDDWYLMFKFLLETVQGSR